MSQAPPKGPDDILHVDICAPNSSHLFFLLIISIQNELTNNPSNIHTITKKPNIKRYNDLCNTYKNLDFKGKCVI
jgi:hypothetical protein